MDWKTIFFEKRFSCLVGLGGISRHESKMARRCGRVYTWLMIIVAIVLLSQWQLELLGDISNKNIFLINWLIFVFFVAELLSELIVVKDRLRYISQNWSLPIIIFLGIFFVAEYAPVARILGPLRPLLAIYLLFPAIRTLISFFIDGQLRTTLLAAAVIVVIFGLLVAGVDPSVKSPWDGIWWAIATVSTVGYGDVVPSSALGRVIGVLLVVIGLGIFVIITANILAITLRKETHQFAKDEQYIDELLEDVQEVKETQAEAVALLKTLSKRVDDLQQEDNDQSPKSS